MNKVIFVFPGIDLYCLYCKLPVCLQEEAEGLNSISRHAKPLAAILHFPTLMFTVVKMLTNVNRSERNKFLDYSPRTGGRRGVHREMGGLFIHRGLTPHTVCIQ